MTLFRQIALLVSTVYLVLLGAVAWTDFRQSSHFLQGQMQSTANDLATNLGITIANAVAENDLAAIDTLFNSVFDSGYYTRIALVAAGGEVLRVRERQVAGPGVPDWFIAWVPLQPVTGETQVMKRWQPFGTLSVTLHPGYAYTRLYQALFSMLAWFALVAGGGLAALWWLLHVLMKPLRNLRMQAEAIHENRFIQQEPVPRTRELREVVAAMNRMVSKVQHVFDEQAAILKRNHELFYRDSLTGLGNRRSFLLNLDAWLDDEAAPAGVLVLVSLHGLAEANQRCGYEKTNQLISELARLLEQMRPNPDSDQCARLNASEFAVTLQHSTDVAGQYVETVFEAFRSLDLLAAAGPEVWLSAGYVALERSRSTGELLALTDLALTQARSLGPYGAYRGEGSTRDPSRGKGQWRAWLAEALESRRFFLVSQPVFVPARTRTLYHNEIFVRLRDPAGQVIPASQFMPVAASVGLGFAVDREVFRLGLAACESAVQQPVAFNLSASVLADADALAEFDDIVRRYAKSAPGRLSAEATHAALLHHLDATRHVADQLRGYGFAFGIDHFDPGADLRLLQAIRPAYIKIAAHRLLDMASASAGSVQALRTLAGSLDIKIIAVGVDSAESHEALVNLGIDGVQGNFYQTADIWP